MINIIELLQRVKDSNANLEFAFRPDEALDSLSLGELEYIKTWVQIYANEHLLDFANFFSRSGSIEREKQAEDLLDFANSLSRSSNIEREKHAGHLLDFANFFSQNDSSIATQEEEGRPAKRRKIMQGEPSSATAGEGSSAERMLSSSEADSFKKDMLRYEACAQWLKQNIHPETPLTPGVIQDLQGKTEDEIATIACIAAQKGYYNFIQDLLAQKIISDSTAYPGAPWATLLYFAAANGQQSLTSALLQRFESNRQHLLKNPASYTFIHLAFWSGHPVQMEQVLGFFSIQEEIKISFIDFAMWSLAEKKKDAKVQSEIEAQWGCDDKLAELRLMVRIGHVEKVQELWREVFPENEAEAIKKAALLPNAAFYGHENVVKLLLEKGVDVDGKNSVGGTALMFAAQNGHLNVVELLLDRDANINFINSQCVTALMLAAENGHLNVVELLLGREVEINYGNDQGYTALMLAAFYGHLHVVELLLGREAEINCGNNENYTALMLAAQNGREKVVELLLGRKAEINYGTVAGYTALMLAAQNGHEKVVELLLRKEAEINYGTDAGSTALMLAAQNGHEKVVELLLVTGAGINYRDKKGHTALMLAAQNGHEKVVKLLLGRKANFNDGNIEGHTALMLAAAYGHENVVELLLDRCFRINLLPKGIITISQPIGEPNWGFLSCIFAYDSGMIKRTLEDCQQLRDSKGLIAYLQKMYELLVALCGHSNSTFPRLGPALQAVQGIFSQQKNAPSLPEVTPKVILAEERMINWRTFAPRWIAKFMAAVITQNVNRPDDVMPNLLIKIERLSEIERAAESKMFYQNLINELKSIVQIAPHIREKIAGSTKGFRAALPLLSQTMNLKDPNEAGFTELLLAAEDGNLKLVETLLGRGANINHKGVCGLTILMLAAGRGHQSMVEFLLHKGADVNSRSSVGFTALMLAAQSGHEKVIELLLKNKVNVNDKDYLGFTACVRASMKGHERIVELLLKNTANVNDRCYEASTALLQAASYGHERIIARLLAGGADINYRARSGFTALGMAVLKGHEKIVKFLLENGADIKDGDIFYKRCRKSILAVQSKHSKVVRGLLEKGADIEAMYLKPYTVLMLAAENGNEKMAELLLDHGANINHKDEEHFTALMLAAFYGHLNVVELLLGREAEINSCTDTGYTALMLAAENGNEKVVELLLGRDASINSFNDEGYTALMLAAENGHEKVVELLLGRGADINCGSDRTYTALMYAAENGHEKVVELLLGREAEINSCTDTGYTALMLAAENGHEKVVDLLLKKDAAINLVNYQGNTALRLAAQKGHDKVIELLLKKDADINPTSCNCDIVLMLAAENGYEKVVELLLDKGGLDINHKVCASFTTLMLAAQKGHDKVIELLLQKDAAINLVNYQGNTALTLAVENGHDKVVELLLDRGARIDLLPKGITTILQWPMERSYWGVVSCLLAYHPELLEKVLSNSRQFVVPNQLIDGYLQNMNKLRQELVANLGTALSKLDSLLKAIQEVTPQPTSMSSGRAFDDKWIVKFICAVIKGIVGDGRVDYVVTTLRSQITRLEKKKKKQDIVFYQTLIGELKSMLHALETQIADQAKGSSSNTMYLPSQGGGSTVQQTNPSNLWSDQLQSMVSQNALFSLETPFSPEGHFTL